jgi:hypothetical protein
VARYFAVSISTLPNSLRRSSCFTITLYHGRGL